MLNLDLALLRNFAFVARTGSISLAAQQAGRTQSALSMQMQRLEEQLGQELLQRTGAGVRLTSGGEKLLVHADALLAQHDNILSDMRGGELRGQISLGCPEDYAISFLPDLLQGFCASYPDVELRLVCAPTSELRPLLLRRQIDMALLSLSDANNVEVIRKERLVWVANSKKPTILDSPILPLALSAPDALDYRVACDAVLSIGRQYRVAFASNSYAGLVAIARSGHAISVLTESAVPSDLAIVQEGLPPLTQIGMVVETMEQRPSAALAALSEHIRATLPTL